VASAQIDISYDVRPTGFSSSSSGREIGWAADIEYALTPSLFLGLEYNYLHFRTDATPPPLHDIAGQMHDADIDIRNVMVRLNYRFRAGAALGLAARDRLRQLRKSQPDKVCSASTTCRVRCRPEGTASSVASSRISRR
jgi:hypothetical protein